MTAKTKKQAFIDKYCGGDVALFESTMVNYKPERDKEFIEFSNRSVLSWRDIEISAKCAPQNQKVVLFMIEKWLGYLPEPHAYVPYLGFLQTVLENEEIGVITEPHSLAEIFFYMKHIRNDDMKSGGWVRFQNHSKADYQQYNNYLAVYRQDARERLSRFLGQEPILEYSIYPEIFLRQLFQLDTYHSGMHQTALDYKALTAYRYREAYLTRGEAVADATNLSGHYRGR